MDLVLRGIISAHVTRMPAHEDRFWAVVDGMCVDHDYARRMLDIAVDWIGAGRTELVDPYELVTTWLPARG